MTVEERLRKFTSVVEDLHHAIDPLRHEMMLLEHEIGYDNHLLIDASDMVIRRQDSLQQEYIQKIVDSTGDAKVEALLKEFEEEFYNAVLDYKNLLLSLRS